MMISLHLIIFRYQIESVVNIHMYDTDILKYGVNLTNLVKWLHGSWKFPIADAKILQRWRQCTVSDNE